MQYSLEKGMNAYVLLTTSLCLQAYSDFFIFIYFSKSFVYGVSECL